MNDFNFRLSKSPNLNFLEKDEPLHPSHAHGAWLSPCQVFSAESTMFSAETKKTMARIVVFFFLTEYGAFDNKTNRTKSRNRVSIRSKRKAIVF